MKKTVAAAVAYFLAGSISANTPADAIEGVILPESKRA